MILAVDLAARLSAAVQRRSDGGVQRQFDSRDKSPVAFCAEIARAARSSDVIVIEDVPYGVANQHMIKPVLRLQGVLIAALIVHSAAERTVFMSPSVWMKEWPGILYAPKGMTKDAGDAYRIDQAEHYAREAGYTPPDLVAEYIAALPDGTKVLKKHTKPLEKSRTDYVSAYLISEFARRYTREELLAMPGVQDATL